MKSGVNSKSEKTSTLQKQLKVLTVCISHSWGGLEQVAASDTLELLNSGFKVHALCLRDTPIHRHLQKHPGVELEILDYRPRDHFDLNLKKDLKRLIALGINLIHVHQTSLLGSIVPWIWTESKVSLFASRHIMNSHPKKSLYHRWIYGRLDALVVMSHTLQDNIIETHPLSEAQVPVVHLGLDFNRFDPAKVQSQQQRSAWGADQDTLVIGLVGRIDPAKGQDVFIKAAAGLINRVPHEKKLKFVIVGEETLGQTSNSLSELKSMVSQFRLDDRVVFTGYQENIPEIMNSFDLFVMPSKQEAFGLVAIEAMAMECPIIISSGGSAAEIVGEEEYGLLMQPEDAFDLQRQIRFMIDHPEKRAEMGKKARAHVMGLYDRRIRLEQTLRLYEKAHLKRNRI